MYHVLLMSDTFSFLTLGFSFSEFLLFIFLPVSNNSPFLFFYSVHAFPFIFLYCPFLNILFLFCVCCYKNFLTFSCQMIINL